MLARIEMVGNRIQFRSMEPVRGMQSMIPGAYFSDKNPTDPFWSLPLTMSTCHLLRENFGKSLRIGDKLAAWARDETARQQHLSALNKAHDAELTRVGTVSPVLAAAMSGRTYQRSGARFVADGNKVLIADDPGLGKTLEAIGGVIETGLEGPYLVVCPKTACESVWARELERWAPGSHIVTLPEGKTKRDEVLDALAGDAGSNTWVVVHPYALRTKSWWVCDNRLDPHDFSSKERCGQETKVVSGMKELDCGHNKFKTHTRHDHEFPQIFTLPYSVIIMDESHEVLVSKNKTGTLARRGAEVLRDLQDERMGLDKSVRIALSGTPFRSRPWLLFGTLNWLNPKKYTSRWNLIKTYWRLGGYSGYEIGEFIEERAPMLYAELDKIMLRRTKAEVAQDLPPKTRVGSPIDPDDETSPNVVWLDMTPAQEKGHDSILVKGAADLEGGTLDAIGVLAERTRMKQFASSAGKLVGGTFRPILPSNKFDYIVEKLEEMGFPGTPNDPPTTKVVIVSQYTEILDMIADNLRIKHKIESVTIDGSVTGKKRREVLDIFNTGEPPHVMLLQTKTGGVAITIDSADEMFIVDETDVDDDQIQVEDRIHRVSNPRPVFYHYLKSRDSIEIGIALRNYEAKKRGLKLMDGRRGVGDFKEELDALKRSKERVGSARS